MATERCGKGGRGGNTIEPISKKIREASKKELGEIIRLPITDPRRKVTFTDELTTPNLPEVNRVGRPRENWIITTMAKVWVDLNLDIRNQSNRGQQFDPQNNAHLEEIRLAAEAGDF